MNGQGSVASARNLAQPQVQQFLIYGALDEGPSLIFVADEEMRYVAVNQTACRTLGYTREELLSLAVTDVAVDVEAPRIYDDMLRARGHRGVSTIRAKDGRLLSLSYNASEVRVSGLPYWLSIGHIEGDSSS